MRRAFILIFGLICAAAYADGPGSQPTTVKDATVEWLLSTQPITYTYFSDVPLTQPLPPLERGAAVKLLLDTTEVTSQVFTSPDTQPSTFLARTVSRSGILALSDGHIVRGSLSTTPYQPLRVWIEEKQEYDDIDFSEIRSIQSNVVWERDEPEWKFAASGSDVKEYSGRTYPARQTDYTFTLKDGSTVSGAVSAPIYIETGGTQTGYILHKRDKGDPGQTLNSLVYIKNVTFGD